jgi:hypothetical protein
MQEPKLKNRLRDRGAMFISRKIATQTADMLAACPARIATDVVKKGRWFYVIPRERRTA